MGFSHVGHGQILLGLGNDAFSRNGRSRDVFDLKLICSVCKVMS
jgi:hypothetical protein